MSVFGSAVIGAELQETSGVVRSGDDLLMVGNEDAGTLFRYTMPDPSKRVFALEAATARYEQIKSGAHLARDLEDIAILADKRVVLLSEELSLLLDMNGNIVVDYDGPFASFGNRGLEGVDVRPDATGQGEALASRIAVVWEGGNPQRKKLLWGLQGLAEKKGELRPVVLTHTLKAGQTGLSVKAGMKKQKDGKPGHENFRKELKAELFELDVPQPPDHVDQGRVYRVPALVWKKLKVGAETQWGFIALLSVYKKSQNIDEKRLHKFKANGKRCGKPLKLDALFEDANKHRHASAPKAKVSWNWEGMSWFDDKRKSLVLVPDRDKDDKASAVVITPAADWLKGC
ncbi:MAG: hypothetical protein AAGF81_06140 [Pseudomonadota bacterium]